MGTVSSRPGKVEKSALPASGEANGRKARHAIRCVPSTPTPPQAMRCGARLTHLANSLYAPAILALTGCAANPETQITPGLLAKTPVCLTLHWDHRPSPAGHAAPDTLILLPLDDDPQNYADTARAWGYASNATAWGRGAVAPTQGTAKVEDGCGG
jgi:hypothetical protein